MLEISTRPMLHIARVAATTATTGVIIMGGCNHHFLSHRRGRRRNILGQPVPIMQRHTVTFPKSENERSIAPTYTEKSNQTGKKNQQRKQLSWRERLRNFNWRGAVRTIKYVRIPFIVLTVFGIGYNQGIIDYSRDPKSKEVALLDTILAGVGARMSDQVPDHDQRLRAVRRVGQRMTSVATRFARDKVKRSVEECAKRVTDMQEQNKSNEECFDSKAVQHAAAVATDPTCKFWAAAHSRMTGSWEYIVVNSSIPNAFVSEILPRRIFVTTAMLDMFIENDDEMGLILGHELSHLMLGHVSKTNTLETSLRTVEVMLLAIDPTEGLASLFVMLFLSATRKMFGAAYSQQNEREADEMGIKLAAMACYDTKRASEVFRKLHLHETESGASVALQQVPLLGFFDTHPSSDERHEFLLTRSIIENKEKYEDDECRSVKDKLLDLLKRRR